MSRLKKSGSVLVIVLWVMALLVLFALGLGNRAAIGLRVAKHERDRLKATYLGRTGVQYAIALLEADLNDPDTKSFDTLDFCGVNLKHRLAQDVFSKSWNNGDEGFKIGYAADSNDFRYGFRDEESRINVNGFANADTKILIEEVLKLKNISDSEGLAALFSAWIAAGENSVQDYKGDTLSVPEEFFGVCEYFYLKKNESREVSRGKARRVYESLKEFITVFGDNKINVNTVSEEALKVFARTVARARGMNAQKADSLVSSILLARNASSFNSEEAVASADLGADNEEKELYENIKGNLCVSSRYFRIECNAYSRGVKKKIKAVYDRRDGKILLWREN